MGLAACKSVSHYSIFFLHLQADIFHCPRNYFMQIDFCDSQGEIPLIDLRHLEYFLYLAVHPLIFLPYDGRKTLHFSGLPASIGLVMESAASEIVAIGVLNSWVMLLMKSVFILRKLLLAENNMNSIPKTAQNNCSQ
jgi:hypothetical protein